MASFTRTGFVNYSGATTVVSNGVLAIASDSTSLDNSPVINTVAGYAATPSTSLEQYVN